MAPRYRAEVDESGHPVCPKKHKLRPLDASEYDSDSALHSPQLTPRDVTLVEDSASSLSSPTSLKPLRSALRKREPQEQKPGADDLGAGREPSSSSTARPMTCPAQSSTPMSPAKPARSALRSKRPDCSNPQEPADGDESPRPPPPRSALKQKRAPPEDASGDSPCKAAPDLASPASPSAPSSPPKVRSALKGGGSRPTTAPEQEAAPPPPTSPQAPSKPKSALKSSNSTSPPRPCRKISVMCAQTNRVEVLKKSRDSLPKMDELKEGDEEEEKEERSASEDAGENRTRRPPKARDRQRLSIWDDPMGDSVRGVLFRIYRFSEQQWLWQQDLEASKRREGNRSSLTVEVPDDDPCSPRLVPGEDPFDEDGNAGQMRRPSRVILKAQANCGDGSSDRFRATASPRPQLPVEDEEEEEEEKQPKELNPLRGILTSKKVDVNRLREAIDELDAKERKMWLESKLEIGPPMVPSALWHVTAMGRPDLVSLVLEYSVDVSKVYDGTAMYMGSIKPGTTALECVKNRKGRFVGTMLGDRLELIEGLLLNAQKQQADRASEKAVFSDKEISKKRGKRITTTICSRGDTVFQHTEENKKRLITTAICSLGDAVFTHTQGHPIQSYEIASDQQLGREDTSSCLMGFHKDTFNPVAIKVTLKPENGADRGEEAQVWEEIGILRKLKHCNVISLVETFEDDVQIFVVLELCKGGPLFDRLLDEQGKKTELQERHFLRLIRQLANSVSYIHERCICHRDIQPCNFLLHDQRPLQEGIVKLIDFSTAKEYGNNHPAMKTKICTPSYVAPEILHREELPYTERVDVWSLGVVFFVILCGSLPFPGESEVDILKKVKRGNLKFKPEAVWDTVSAEAKACVQQMLVKKPEDRCTAEQVTEHPWLSKAEEE